MIDKGIFQSGLAVLAGAFSRDLDEAVILTYYRVLSPKLSTEEFQQAVQIVLETETFWPAPAKLTEAVRRKAVWARGLAQVIDALRNSGGFRFFPHTEFLKFSPEIRAGIRAAGGLRAIGLAETADMPRLERRFAEGYHGDAGALTNCSDSDPELPRIAAG